MSKRPDWLKCIEDPSRDPFKAICGRKFNIFETTFTDVAHAYVNAVNEGRLVTCPNCAKAVAAVFLAEETRAKP